MGSLSDSVWLRIDEIMLSKKLSFRDLRGLIRRNKNTYSNWRRQPRPILRISDLEDLARALQVDPSSLLVAPDTAELDPSRQLALPFDRGATCVEVCIECSDGGLIIRPLDSNKR